MRPVRIYLKNFMQYYECEIDFTGFSSCLIVGKKANSTKHSNGVGKTTLIRSIEFALFNECHANTLDKIIKIGTKKGIVEFDFEMNNSVYRICRQRTSTGTGDVRLYQKNEDGDFISISKTTSTETEEKIKSIIKISHKAFIYSVLFRQADLNGLSSVDDPKKRQDILKEPLDLTKYTKLGKIAADKTKPIKKDIDRVENSISMLGDPNSDITKTQEDIKTTKANIQIKNQETENVEETISKKEKFSQDLKESLNSTDSSVYEKIDLSEKTIKKLISTLSSNQSFLKSLLDSKKNKESLLPQERIKFDSSKKLLDENLAIKTRDISVIESELTDFTQRESRGSELISSLKTEIRILKDTIPDGDFCPACKQSITTDYRKHFEEDVDKKLKEKQEKLSSYESGVTKCKAKKANLEIELKKTKQKQLDISKNENIVKNSEEKISSLSKEIQDLSENIEQYKSSNILPIQNQKEQEEQNLVSLKEMAKSNNVNDLNDKITKISSEIDLENKKLLSIKSEISSLTKTEGALTERIKTRSSDLSKLESFKKELFGFKNKLKIQQMAINAFSQSIPTSIIQMMLNDLQYEVTTAIKELRPELDIQIDEELNIIYRRNGEIREYTLLSYGQQVYLALAFKRGVSKVIQKRMGVDLKLLQFDEVDASLDEAGQEALADCIQKWQKDHFIFVITHNKFLKDKFSTIICVEESDLGSTCKITDTW
jgi:DNA repair exonuclease SbcCD ATPase subunit